MLCLPSSSVSKLIKYMATWYTFYYNLNSQSSEIIVCWFCSLESYTMYPFPLQLENVSHLRPTKYEIHWFCFCTPRTGIPISLRGYFAYKAYGVTHGYKTRTLNCEIVFAAALLFWLTSVRKSYWLNSAQTGLVILMVALIIKINMKRMHFSTKLPNFEISFGCMFTAIHLDHFLERRQQMPSAQNWGVD